MLVWNSWAQAIFLPLPPKVSCPASTSTFKGQVKKNVTRLDTEMTPNYKACSHCPEGSTHYLVVGFRKMHKLLDRVHRVILSTIQQVGHPTIRFNGT